MSLENLSLPINQTGGGSSGGLVSGPTEVGSSDNNLVLAGSSILLDGGLELKYNEITEPTSGNTFTIQDYHYLIDITSDDVSVVYLPSANSKTGQTFIVYNHTSKFITVQPLPEDNIEGDLSMPLPPSGQTQLIATGHNTWLLI